jgi:uncharacterized protein (DUF2147 family)
MAIDPAAADPRGIWQANDGSRVRIASCGKALCGTKVSAKRSPTGDRPALDRQEQSRCQQATARLIGL